MELRPADLGEAWHIAIVRLRAASGGVGQYLPLKRLGRQDDDTVASPSEAGSPGFWGRRWVRDLRLSPRVADATLPLTRRKTANATGSILGGFFWVPLGGLGAVLGSHSPEVASLVLAATAGMGWLAFDVLPRRALRSLHHRSLSSDEIRRLRENLAPQSGPSSFLNFTLAALIGEQLQNLLLGGPPAEPGIDPAAYVLEDEYLQLLQDTLRTPVYSPEAEATLKSALKLLGEAIMQMPLPPGSTQGYRGRDDVGDLVADAEMLLARARREADSVVAESLVRQAEAKAAQARAVDNALRLTRRTRVLRDELRAQVAATRATLPSLSSSVGASAATVSAPLRRVADSVQAVAREAASVYEAREELAASLGEPFVYGPAEVVESAATAPPPSVGYGARRNDNDTPSRRVFTGRR